MTKKRQSRWVVDSDICRQAERRGLGQAGKTGCKEDRRTDGRTYRQTYRQTDKETGGQTVRQMDRKAGLGMT